MRHLFMTAVILAIPVVAIAAPITFDTAPQGSIFGPTYSENGYTLTGTDFAFPQIDEFAFTTFANDGSLTLNYKGPTYTLTRDNGGLFKFNRFALGNVNGNANGGVLRVALNGGTPIDYAIPATNALTNFSTFSNKVSSVSFSFSPGETANNSLNSYARLDNLLVSAAGVPEPTAWEMMIGGFGLIGGTMRRRSQSMALTA